MEKEVVAQALAKVYATAYAAHVAAGKSDVLARDGAQSATKGCLRLLHELNLEIE